MAASAAAVVVLFISCTRRAYDVGAGVERKLVTAAAVDCWPPLVLPSRPVRTPFAEALSLSATCHKQIKNKNQISFFLSFFSLKSSDTNRIEKSK